VPLTTKIGTRTGRGCPDPDLARRGIAAYEGEPGREYLYIPREVLVHADDAELVDGELRRFGAVDDRAADLDRNAEPDPAQDWDRRHRRDVGEVVVPALAVPDDHQDRVLEGIGVRRYFLPPDVDVPSVVTRLRNPASGRRPRIGPNHVLVGEKFYMGGPGSIAAPAGAFDDPARGGDGTAVAVLDTGIVPTWQDPGSFLAGRLRTDHCPWGVDDVADEDGDAALDVQAGHGTFIAGIVARHHPAGAIQAVRALNSLGIGDEATVAASIAMVRDQPVINLSLGNYFADDRPGLGVELALRALDPEVVVVAAAGNSGQSRPFWPAASKRVIAVAAHDGQRDPTPACFSNFGPWVDCCAPGVDIESVFLPFDGNQTGRPDPDDFTSAAPGRWSGFARWSGTSFATPAVAAVIARDDQGTGSPRDSADRLIRLAPDWLADYGAMLTLHV
jgi:subtilisin family serine protease